MKLHLPIKLRCAVVAACLLTASAYAEVADVEGTVSDFNSTYSETAKTFTPNYVGNNAEELMDQLEISSGATMRNVVFSSDGELEISWGDTPVTVGSTLCVREGTLVISDSTITKTVVSGANHLNMQISGSNASLVLDNTSYTCSMKDTLNGDVMHVGGHSGAGSLTLQNNSHLDVTTWLIVGIASKAGYTNSAGYKLYTTTAGSSSGVYVGDFRHTDSAGTVFMRNLDYGTGSIVINAGCSLTVGGYLGLRDGSVTITGAGATLTTGNGTYFQNNTNIHGDTNSDMLGRGAGCLSIVKIENGGVWNAMGHLSTGSRDTYEAKTVMSVDGNGSQLNVAKTLALGYGESGAHGTVCSTELSVTNGGAVNVGANFVVGPQASKRGANPTYVYVDENSTINVAGSFIVNAPTTVAPNADGIVYLGSSKHIKVDANGFETEFVNHGSITCGSLTMNGGSLYNSGSVAVSGTMLLKDGAITLGIRKMHSSTAAFSAGAVSVQTADGSDYVIQLEVLENLEAGRYLLVERGGAATVAAEGSTTGGTLTFGGLESYNGMTVQWGEDGNLYLMLNEQVMLTRDPLADAVQAGNWGVFRSSQAFVSTLWGPRDNSVNLSVPTPSGKRGLQASAAAQTIAWGSVYSSNTHQGGSGTFGGANYSIYGAAIGAERQFVSGRSLGVAFGYDYGKASPFATSRVNQDSWHAALYGRAGSWNVGNKGSVALDWSVAVGNTTSECNRLGSDWSQDSLQLDVRATYSYNLNSRTAVSAFAGVQYYAQGDDSTSRVTADSLQNLRLQAGAGISYRATDRATVYGELAIHNDTMRHNPSVRLDNMNYGSGANPGRLGGSVTVGAQYQLNGGWSLNGSYSFEGTDNSGEHNVNVGAVYSF